MSGVKRVMVAEECSTCKALAKAKEAEARNQTMKQNGGQQSKDNEDEGMIGGEGEYMPRRVRKGQDRGARRRWR